MKKLYQIWYVGATQYPMTEIISVMGLYRDQVISTDLPKLQKVCDRLNFIAYRDERYEIREEPPRENS